MRHRTIHVLSLCAVLAGAGSHLRAEDDFFPELQVGSIVYTNARVANRTATDVFIRYEGGFANLKVADLAPGVLQKLGYDGGQAAREDGPVISLSKLQADPRVQAVQQRLTEGVEGSLLQMDQGVVAAAAIALFVFYLFTCYCTMLVCRNAGSEPGPLVWIPCLQIFPMLRAAGMSPWCALLMLLPVVNLVVSVLWCLKIAGACGKSALVGVLLLLPGIGFFAFLYLAFSGERQEPNLLRPVKLKLSES